MLHVLNKNQPSLHLDLKYQQPTLCYASVIIPAPLVDALYNQAVLNQQQSTPTFGFHKKGVPFAYIEHNFKANLLDHLKEFLFKYSVLGFLFREIREKKLLVAGEPRLAEIYIEPQKDALFTFELSLFTSCPLAEWKYLPFKAPKRKNYKDLDRQVECFLHDELTHKESYKQPTISIGDWVNFSIELIDSHEKPILHDYKTNVWLRIGDEEPDKPFQELFLGKKIGDTIITNARCIQDYFSEFLNINYLYRIIIADIMPFAFFCIDHFKNHFRLKTNKEMYQKMIEVFSYRNDLSQRRTMVEESLKLLLSKNKFEIPNHLVLRQQKNVMDAVQTNPDYHVYRAQKDFKDRIKELAEKQIREQLFVDQLGYNEDIVVSHNDIKSYLNLTKRPRMKEFIYFDSPVTKINGQEIPIITDELLRNCLREKTVNHIIYHLTKK